MPEMTCPLTAASRRWPRQQALVSVDGALTYHELARRVAAAASSLREAGVTLDERVGILAENCRAYPILLHALWRLGAVTAPISPRFPREAAQRMLDQIGCRTLVTDERLPAGSMPQKIRSLDMQQLVTGRDVAADVEKNLPDFDPARSATIIFTSGSTDEPKAVLHSYAGHYYSALGSNENIILAPGDRWLISLPLWHVGGLSILFRTLLAGATAVIADAGEPLSEVIARCRITHLSLVATQLRRLLEQGLPRETAEQLKAVLVGGGSVPAHLVDEARERDWPICTTYGLTEMASQVTTTSPNDPSPSTLSSGRPLKHRELQLAAAGEIMVRGRTLFKGYLAGASLDRARDDDGWFHSGDIGRLDPEGRLIVTGRKDNMFISGGENIYPEEIETVLATHPQIEQAVVVPIPDDEFGQRPVAFVRFGSDEELSRDAILAHLDRLLPRFKLPVRLYRWPDDITDRSLKLDRAALAALAARPDSVQLN